MSMETRDRTAQLEEEVRRAYHALGEVTSRLLLVNESAEAILSTPDRSELAKRFLEIVARACDTRRSALFIHDGRNLHLGASFGLSEAEEEALLDSAQAVEHCDRALAKKGTLVLDPDQAPGLDDGAGPDGGGRSAAVGEEAEEAEEEEEEEEASDAAGAEAGAADEVEEAEGEEETKGEAVAAPEFGIYLPALLGEEPVAVLALGERALGRPYGDEELSLLNHLLSQLAVALNRSVLMERNEQRLHELDALLRVSREITSTLDVDAVLRGVVNTAGAVVENDRCQLLLLEGGRLRVRAVTGLTRIPADQVEMTKTGEVLEWLRLAKDRVVVSADDLGSGKEIPGADVFNRYFESQVMRSFMALPLKDDQGLLGFLCLESKQDAWDLDPSVEDALDILGAQTTVALRNAMLYSQIPMRGVAAPVLRARAGWRQLSPEKRRWLLVGTAVALVLAALPIVPGRIGGTCEVLPARSFTVRAETDGVVRQVLARGGEAVAAGQTLAVLEDPWLSARMSQLRGKLEAARVAGSRAQERGDALEFRLQQLQAQELGERLAFEESRARRTRLQAPVPGHVLELNLAEQVGRYLEAGDPFCRVSALSSMRAEVLVDENLVRRVRPGSPAQLKVVAYPARTFRGKVSEVSWQAEPHAGGARTFRVRVDLPNADLALRPGMTGFAKIHTGSRAFLGMLAEPFIRWARLTWW